MTAQHDRQYMQVALELAAQGRGFVEPNPLVGCLIVRAGEILGKGWHREFGGPHAEVEALGDCEQDPRGATAYVTLEPCCHTGKTPPCTDALLAAGIARVVVAQQDPFPPVAGGGIQQLRAAGVQVELGVGRAAAESLNAPYLTLIRQQRPWVIAKWAMTCDGKIATSSGHSQWISNESSRAQVHQLRGRVDAIIVGRGTVLADDPLLNARPAGPRTATRIVCDGQASIPLESQLVKTAHEFPLLIAAGGDVPARRLEQLQAAGVEIFQADGETQQDRLQQLLAELGRRRATNVLVEGGPGLLGSFFDAELIDEVHVYIAPKLVGGQHAPHPIGGTGRNLMNSAMQLRDPQSEMLNGDIHLWGRVKR